MTADVRAAGAPRWRRVGDVAAIVFLALVAAALVVGAVPLRNGRVQDCGAPIAFSLGGRLDQVPAADGTIERGGRRVDLSEAEIRRAYAEPCSDQVGGRMAVVAVLGATAAVAGVIAATGFLVDLLKTPRPAALDPVMLRLPLPPDEPPPG